MLTSHWLNIVSGRQKISDCKHGLPAGGTIGMAALPYCGIVNRHGTFVEQPRRPPATGAGAVTRHRASLSIGGRSIRQPQELNMKRLRGCCW